MCFHRFTTLNTTYTRVCDKCGKRKVLKHKTFIFKWIEIRVAYWVTTLKNHNAH